MSRNNQISRQVNQMFGFNQGPQRTELGANTVVVDVDEYEENGYHVRRETKRTPTSMTQTTTKIGRDGSRSVHTTTTSYQASSNSGNSTTSSTSSTTTSSSSHSVNGGGAHRNTSFFSTQTPFLNSDFMENVLRGRTNSSYLQHINPMDIYNQHNSPPNTANNAPPNGQNRPRAFIEEIDSEEEEDDEEEYDEDKIMRDVLANSMNEFKGGDLGLDEEDLELQRAINESMMMQQKPKPTNTNNGVISSSGGIRSDLRGPQREKRRNSSSGRSSSSSSSSVHRQTKSPTINRRNNNGGNANRYNNNGNRNFNRFDIQEQQQNPVDPDDDEIIENERRNRNDEDAFFRNNPDAQQYLTPQAKERYQRYEEAEKSRSLMEEQDKEYRESLEKDRQLQEQKELEAAIALSLENEKQELITKKRAAVPPEPGASSPNTCVICVILPNSTRIQRKFLFSDTIQSVKNWIDITAIDQNYDFPYPSYELTSGSPRNILAANLTLTEILSVDGVSKALFKIVETDQKS